MGYVSENAKAVKDLLGTLGIRRSHISTKQVGKRHTVNGKRVFEPHYTIVRVESWHYGVIADNAQTIAAAGNTVFITTHKGCGKVTDASIHGTGNHVERTAFDAADYCDDCQAVAKESAPVSLPFTPSYYPNDDEGTDVRDGNGDIIGWTWTNAGGRFVANVVSGILSSHDTDQGAIDAILRHFGTPVADQAATETETEDTEESATIGMRVSGEIQGQAFVGEIVTTFARRGVLEAVHVRTDNGLKTPAGRTVYGAIVRGESLKTLRILRACNSCS